MSNCIYCGALVNNPDPGDGRSCDVEGCPCPAGTAWSPYWCFEHNVERLDRINKALDKMLEQFK